LAQGQQVPCFECQFGVFLQWVDVVDHGCFYAASVPFRVLIFVVVFAHDALAFGLPCSAFVEVLVAETVAQLPHLLSLAYDCGMENIQADGVNGVAAFDGTTVTITRKGFLGRATVGKGTKMYPVHQISAIQWKEPGKLVNGFFSLTMAGAQERRSKFGQQTIDATHDENSIIVNIKQAPDFKRLMDAINQANAPTNAPVPSGNAGVEELMKLSQLHAQGALTDEEFSAAKARLLGL
jgi:hypothetical protein